MNVAIILYNFEYIGSVSGINNMDYSLKYLGSTRYDEKTSLDNSYFIALTGNYSSINIRRRLPTAMDRQPFSQLTNSMVEYSKL